MLKREERFLVLVQVYVKLLVCRVVCCNYVFLILFVLSLLFHFAHCFRFSRNFGNFVIFKDFPMSDF